jgi:hypothetical protein
MSYLPSLGLGEADIVEKSVHIAGSIKNADNLDAINQCPVENKQPGKALDVPSANVGMRRVLEPKAGSHPGHPGELQESLLGMVNEAQSHVNASFG